MQTVIVNSGVMPYREVNHDGVDYFVVNGVALVEGVLNSRYVPAQEFAAFPMDWNGVPVVMRHPKQNGGSARVASPDVAIVGRFFNARTDRDGKRLMGEFWLDKNRLAGCPEGPEVVERIKGGRMVEVSTGYYSQTDREQGVWGNKNYTMVDRNIHPDHIALLPDEVGACSIVDGCGLNRNAAQVTQNCAATCPCKQEGKLLSQSNTSSGDEDVDNGLGIFEVAKAFCKFFGCTE